MTHQSHYCLYYNGIPEFVRKRFDVNSTIALQQPKIFEISLSESQIYWKWQTSAIIREISDSNLETLRNGSKSGLSQIIRESRQPCKLSLYYTLIYPYLSYCNIVWSSTYNTHLNRIFIVQKSAIHALSKSEYRAHTAPLFVKPKILNTYGVFMFHVAKLICSAFIIIYCCFLLFFRGGGDLLLSHTQLPLLNFSKMPFALFVGTSNLHSV